MKTCFKCKETKPLDEFYRHSQMSDGHLGKCKTCARSDAKSRRKNPRFRAMVLAYDRERGSRRTADDLRIYRAENPEAVTAHRVIAYALRTGKICRPSKCEACATDCIPHGHHHDYSKPLSVVWLCATCHQQHHAMMRLIEKSMNREEGQPLVRADVLAREAKERRKVAKLARSQAHAGQTEMEG